MVRKVEQKTDGDLSLLHGLTHFEALEVEPAQHTDLEAATATCAFHARQLYHL